MSDTPGLQLDRAEFDGANPFCTLPQIELRNQTSKWIAMIGSKRFTFPLMSQDAVVACEIR